MPFIGEKSFIKTVKEKNYIVFEEKELRTSINWG